MGGLFVDDDLLNAYLDGELAAQERAALEGEIGFNAELGRRLDALRVLRAQIVQAYDNPPRGRAQPRFAYSHWQGYALAAGFGAVLAVGVLWAAGLLQPDYGEKGSETPSLASADKTIHRVLFHLSSAEPKLTAALFDQIEIVMATFKQRGIPIRAELVANNRGLDIYRVDRTEFASRIRNLHRRYPGLVFAACGNSLRRLARRERASVNLLPEAIVIDSGVAELSRRQKQGWLYVKA